MRCMRLAVCLIYLHLRSRAAASGAAEFFVGSHPESTSVSYLAGSLFTGGNWMAEGS